MRPIAHYRKFRTLGYALSQISRESCKRIAIVNASDAALILIAAASIGAGEDAGLTDAQKAAADVNHDGSVNASDAAIVLIYSAAVGAGKNVRLTDFIR